MLSNLCKSLAPAASALAKRTRGALLLTLACFLGACAALPPRGVVESSSALPYQGDTTLAVLAAASRPSAETAPSGFRLLPTGEFAFDARLSLVRRAQRSIDLQAYHIHHDVAGRALLRELREAAQRGVRVRLLVDDCHAGPLEPMLADLSAHSSVQVRLFNPLPLRSGSPILRLLLSPGSFERHNHRMHNKLLVADNTMAVFGGRNVADEYFMGHADANFIDLDVLGTGAVVQELSAVFDRYWNSEAAWPLLTLQGRAAPQAAAARERFDAEVGALVPPAAPYETDPAGHGSVESQLQRGWLTLHHATAQVFADPPEKALLQLPLTEPTAAMAGMLGVMARAQREVHIVSPYFVPGPIGMAIMTSAAAAGGRTVLYTNSLGTTDEPLVHYRYSSYRVPMLRLGVEIMEFSSGAVQRSLSFGRFGASTPRLHAKVALVDRRHMLVGSVNLDGRSALANTEMAVAIDSPALATELRLALEGERAALLYRLRLSADGQGIEWLLPDKQGLAQVSTEEPGSGAWLSFKLWLQSLLVDERLL